MISTNYNIEANAISVLMVVYLISKFLPQMHDRSIPSVNSRDLSVTLVIVIIVIFVRIIVILVIIFVLNFIWLAYMLDKNYYTAYE